MNYERRVTKSGKVYYSIKGYARINGKVTRPRMSRGEIRNRFGRDIITEEDAIACLKLLESKHESSKTRILKRLQWEAEFYSFVALLDQYTIKQKKRAPNSWDNNVFYLKHYVLHYFLQVLKLNNIELWSSHFEDFKTWLETAQKVRGGGPISYSGKNHSIKALNTFIEHLYREKIVTTFFKCPAFGEHMLNRRSIDDVITPDEMEIVYKNLLEAEHKSEAYFFRFLYFSGMRYSEGLAISLGDLFQGKIESPFMTTKLTAHKIEYFGYVVSDGQFGTIDDSGHVIRLPFKGKKEIAERFNRIIPIIDRTLWNLMVDIASAKFESEVKVKGKKNCLIFEGIDDATSSERLKKAFEKGKLKYRSWHCLRHSRATHLIGETGDEMLARIWLGHSSPRTIEKYNHIYQALVRAAKSELLTGKEFGLKKV